MSSEMPAAANRFRSAPGRTCPPHYGYAPGALAAAPALEADTLYAAGGLYGNLEALEALEVLARADERSGQRVAILFNGDFHWFDADPAWFHEVSARVRSWTPSAGNVELELAKPSPEAGCGCAYPAHVGDAVVARSNEIMDRLHAAAAPEDRAALQDLPRLTAARVAGVRTLAVHGDIESVAGWRFAAEHLPPAGTALRRRLDVQTEPTPLAWLHSAFRSSGARIIACAHTCLPVFCRLTVEGADCALLNNGAAGMPNFAGTRYGVATRISIASNPPATSIFGFRCGRVRCDAVALEYDPQAWLARFLGTWPEGTGAHTGYFARLRKGPVFTCEEAVRDYRGEDIEDG